MRCHNVNVIRERVKMFFVLRGRGREAARKSTCVKRSLTKSSRPKATLRVSARGRKKK